MTAYVGRNQQLDAYQQAVKEEVTALWGGLPPMTGAIGLRFWFWRHRAEYTTPNARLHMKHDADATNMQKALEDALQGILYPNDKAVSDIHSQIIAQGPDVIGKIVIQMWSAQPGAGREDIPDEDLARIERIDNPPIRVHGQGLSWPPRRDEDLF